MASRKLSIAKTLKSNGVLGIIKTYVTGAGAYDPGTGRMTPRGDDTADSTRAMVLMDQLTKIPSRTYGRSGVTEEVNSQVEGVEKWALIDAIGREPRIQDHIVVGNEEWIVLNVQTIADSSGPVMYILALKR